MPLDRIDRTGVIRWFEGYSATAAGGANLALLVFRQIMNRAIARRHIETNPTRGLKRNPRPKLTRFLSREEIGRLHEVLDVYEPRRPSCKAQVDSIRLTGCRTGEIMKLRWREVDGDTLELEDSKIGPRQVLLSPEARTIIERQPRAGSPWVFPSPMNPAWARRRAHRRGDGGHHGQIARSVGGHVMKAAVCNRRHGVRLWTWKGSSSQSGG